MEFREEDKIFLKCTRSLAILVIVFGHVGGFWFFQPYSSFLLTIVPVFFFVSGSVSTLSYDRSPNIPAYFAKRGINLFVPYYVAALFVLLFFIIEGLKLPGSLQNILHWLTITPKAEKMPFLFSQVWFLRVLVMITVISPLLFEIHKRNRKLLLFPMGLIIVVSILQHSVDIGGELASLDAGVYVFLIYSLFYISGFYYYSESRPKIFALVLLLSSLSLCFILVHLFGIKPSLAEHEYHPDFYYIMAGFSTIALFLLIEKVFLIAHRLPLFRYAINFLHKHTFGIFLLHGFGIYVAYHLFRITMPELHSQHDIRYGLIMLSFTLLATFLVCIPFTAITQRIQKKLLGGVATITKSS